MVWMYPPLLTYFSHHFSVFKNVTSLTIDALHINLFNQREVLEAFGHFFRTVTELGLESPQSHPRDLIAFLRHFSHLESLSISDPEWVKERQFLFHPRKASPPYKGKLELIGLCSDSSLFVSLLSRLPLRFGQLSIIGCSLEGSKFGPLLDRLGESLRSLTISAWFEGVWLTRMSPGLSNGLFRLQVSSNQHRAMHENRRTALFRWNVSNQSDAIPTDLYNIGLRRFDSREEGCSGPKRGQRRRSGRELFPGGRWRLG